MKYCLYLLLISFSSSFGQSIIEWTPEYQLTLKDFQSPQTEISDDLRVSTISSGINIDFSFHMNTYEFMFTKNFNSKVKTTFNKNAAVITAIDTVTALQLLKYGQYYFDLTELYARKFRKQLYQQKKAFSDITFFQPIFNRLQEELQAEAARVNKATELGSREQLLEIERQKVFVQINLLSDFCLECKPPKRKKRKR